MFKLHFAETQDKLLSALLFACGNNSLRNIKNYLIWKGNML